MLSDKKHPDKAAIEDRHAVATHFRARWRIEAQPVGSGSWWLVSFARPTDGFTATILFPPLQQGPEHISSDVGKLPARA